MGIYGYLRVSTETQAEKGGGLEVQLHEIQKYADEHGITIDEWYKDAGISGTKESRPALDEMLARLEEGDIIIVSTTSRLWRDIFAQGFVMKAVMRAKANIRSIDEPSFDVYKYMTDPENFMITGMLGMLDQWERLTIARKLARGRTTKATGGDKPAGVPPYGYKYTDDRKHIAINEDEAPFLKAMFTMGQQGYTLSQIAKGLEERGARTRHGKLWSRGSVQAVLRNRFYIGELTHQGKTIKGNHEPLISRVQFGKVNAQLERRQRI